MATPFKFPGYNIVMRGNGDDVQDLVAYRTGQSFVSAWVLTDAEIEEVRRTGIVMLAVVGRSMPPVLIAAESEMRRFCADHGPVWPRITFPMEPRLAPDSLGWICDACGRSWRHGEPSGCGPCARGCNVDEK